MNLRRLLISFSLLFTYFIGLSSDQPPVSYPLTSHPRLFFLPADEAFIKARISSSPVFNKLHNIIITECNKMLDLPVLQRVVTGGTMVNISREAFRRICYLSYAYRMTGVVSFAARAETEMLDVAAFSDWNPSNQLDFTEMTMAMAIGYDWLYNYLGTSSRLAIANAIKQKGIEETTGAKAIPIFFLQDHNGNYNQNINSVQVGNACIAAGVAAVYDENPAYYQPLIDRAVNLIKFPMGVYQYNGAFPESVMYWEYGTTYNVLLIDLLQRMFGTDRDLTKTEGFLKTANFALHMHGTATQQMNGTSLIHVTSQVFSFGDGGAAFPVMPVMFWFASHAPAQTSLYWEMKKLNFELSDNPQGWLGSNRFLPLLLNWGKDVTTDNLPVPGENTYLALGRSSLAALRTGWSSNDIYLGMKGGTPSGEHSHMDIGSFVMDALEVRWALDIGGGSCTTCTSKWDAYFFNNLGHNTLTFNGNLQKVDGYAPIENLIDTPDRKSVDINLTPIYSGDVASCKRTGAIVSNRYVEIKDVITAGAAPVTVRWTQLTQAVPFDVSNKIIQLGQSSKKLYLVFDGADDVTTKTWTSMPGNGGDLVNYTSVIGFEYTIPAGTTRTVTVKLVPDGDPILAGLNLNGNNTTTGINTLQNRDSFSAYYNQETDKIYLKNLPEHVQRIRLFDPIGRLVQDVQVYGSLATLDCSKMVASVYIVNVIMSDGSFKSVKIVR